MMNNVLDMFNEIDNIEEAIGNRLDDWPVIEIIDRVRRIMIVKPCGRTVLSLLILHAQDGERNKKYFVTPLRSAEAWYSPGHSIVV
jgi:hypothetical protein